jgi:hypothetical protein
LFHPTFFSYEKPNLSDFFLRVTLFIYPTTS